MGLQTYHEERDFRRTPEPKGKLSKANRRRFVCQEHHASSLHFDFRLEIGGVLKSWSVKKGPSMDPGVRRLAVPTEDHPVEYLDFQGDIPEGNYGAGQHRIWDAGTYKLLDGERAEEQFDKGKLKFELKGDKLKGTFNLFRLGGRDQWLLVKGKDEFADEDWKLELLIPGDNGRKFIDDKPKRARRARRQPVHAKPGAKREVIKTDAKPKKGERLPTVAGLFRRKSLEGDTRIEVGEYAVDLTSLDRVYWPDSGFTKANLLRYYYRVADHILPYLNDRPLIMRRFPMGVRGKSFHQHDVDEAPEFVRTVTLEAEDKGIHTVDYAVCDNLATHLYLANLGAIERHPWHSRIENLDCPDWFVFDLDPGEKVEFDIICDVAISLHDVIEELGLESYAKTSGSRGIHVYVPIKAEYPYDQVAKLAEKIAKQVAKENRTSATVERSKAKRKANQIYIDHMQNTYGKSVVAPYSVRPKSGATVSAPLEWDEVRKRSISIGDFTIENMLERIKKNGDIFEPVLTNKQSLDKALRKVG